uniref:Uncharacterized protein n=1 Tax=Lepeophtheirus salmonis TaxID=72036 RepID=A0A0K2UII0_LEPSM
MVYNPNSFIFPWSLLKSFSRHKTSVGESILFNFLFKSSPSHSHFKSLLSAFYSK